MSWSFTAHRGSANSKVSGSVLGTLPSASIAAGSILVAVCASDNVAVAGGYSNTHVVTDFLGNPWQKVLEWTNADVAAAGITGSIWVTRIRQALGTSDPVVLGVRSAVLARAIGLYQYAVGAGNSARMVAAVGSEQDATTSPTIAVNGLAAGKPYAFFGVCFRENDTANTYVQDADYIDRTKFGTTGSTGNTNVSCIVGDRVATTIGDTFAPTALSAASDVVTMLVVMEEVPIRQWSLTFNDSSTTDLRNRLRETYRTASPAELCRLARYVESLGLSDAQLKTLFGVGDPQLPGLKIRIGNQAAIYDSLRSQVGQ